MGIKNPVKEDFDKKCERCGEPANQTYGCRICKTEHVLCPICMDVYMFTYACENDQCFLKEKIMRPRAGAGDK